MAVGRHIITERVNIEIRATVPIDTGINIEESDYQPGGMPNTWYKIKADAASKQKLAEALAEIAHACSCAAQELTGERP